MLILNGCTTVYVFFQLSMCFSVPWGRFMLYCCPNGSYVQFGASESWSERSPLCPPLTEEEQEGGSLMFVVVTALLFLVGVGAAILKRK